MDPETTHDPLDDSSDCYVEEYSPLLGRTIQRVLSFRELARACADDMVLWDSVSPDMRALNQQHNDPNYRPIQPGAGQRKHRRWRG